MIKVLIVDDSATFRSIIRSALSSESKIEIVGTVRDGEHVLNSIKSKRPDVVTLDLEMPVMDGVDVLKAIEKHKHEDPIFEQVKFIIVSSNSPEGAKSSMRAFKYGALDFITKSVKADFDENMSILKEKLIPKILSIKKISSHQEEVLKEDVSIRIHNPIPQTFSPKVLLIGSSTGGPQALMKVLPELSPDIKVPILIVQHMPKDFTHSLALSLDKISPKRVKEAEEGEVLDNNTVYIAPGDYHMTILKNGTDHVIRLNQSPPENFCRPAVDVLFRSASQYFENACIALVLTGMGSDGAKGLASLKRKGAYVIVQDEKTSVVWGMPGNAVRAKVVDRILPLNEIAPTVSKLLT